MNSIDLDKILELLEDNNLLLTGAAGTGKSFLTNKVISSYRKQERGVVALGSTGVSAVNIGGITLHSFFILGICKDFEELKEFDRRNKRRLSELKRLLKATELIVIDEVSMVGIHTLEMIRYRLDSLAYSGKVMFVGDFYQLPPIIQNSSNNLFSNELYAFESGAWESFKPVVIELKHMYRTDDEDFTRVLSKIRRGIKDSEVIDYLFKLYNNTQAYEGDPTWLFGRNLEVERMNTQALDLLDTDEYILFCNTQKHKNINEKRLENWKRMLPVQEELRLKVGAPILFTINKWGKYFNGERGILRAIEDDYLVVEKDEEFVRVEPYEFVLGEPRLDENDNIQIEPLITLEQFPIKLAYSVTIHKSQGMSIDHLVCNIDNIFAPSQFYVALSRATNPNRVVIDSNRGDFREYIDRVIRVDDRVEEFYDSNKNR